MNSTENPIVSPIETSSRRVVAIDCIGGIVGVGVGIAVGNAVVNNLYGRELGISGAADNRWNDASVDIITLNDFDKTLAKSQKIISETGLSKSDEIRDTRAVIKSEIHKSETIVTKNEAIMARNNVNSEVVLLEIGGMALGSLAVFSLFYGARQAMNSLRRRRTTPVPA